MLDFNTDALAITSELRNCDKRIGGRSGSTQEE
jgi:hypothetical protein